MFLICEILFAPDANRVGSGRDHSLGQPNLSVICIEAADGVHTKPTSLSSLSVYTLLWWPSLDLQAQILDDGEHVADISDLRVLAGTD